MKIIILCLFGIVLSTKAVFREKKVLGLFSLVNFPNDPCNTTSSTFSTGVCFTSAECTSKSGSASGGCAAGFGVCCILQASACGSKVNSNCSYITNPNFPTAYTTTGECKFTVSKCQTDICQLRLDYESLTLGVITEDGIVGPANSGYGCCGASCTTGNPAVAAPTDSLTVSGTTGQILPVLCGINSPSTPPLHMYVEVGGGATDEVTLDFDLAGTGDRNWNIKVTQIECSSRSRAGPGCVQYFTGIKGTVTSYGFPGKQILQNQNYNNCIRREAGYCRVKWTENTMDVPTSGGRGGGNPNEGYVDTICTTSTNGFLTIPSGDSSPGDSSGGLASRYCGQALTGVNAGTIPMPITSSSFNLGVFTNSKNQGDSLDPTPAPATGFSLDYMQQLC